MTPTLDALVDALNHYGGCTCPKAVTQCWKAFPSEPKQWCSGALMATAAAALASPVVPQAQDWQPETEHALRMFAQKVLSGYLCQGDEIGDIDGGTLQELADACGLLRAVTMTQPCGEYCGCAETTDFPALCYRATELLLPSISAGSLLASDPNVGRVENREAQSNQSVAHPPSQGTARDAWMAQPPAGACGPFASDHEAAQYLAFEEFARRNASAAADLQRWRIVMQIEAQVRRDT